MSRQEAEQMIQAGMKLFEDAHRRRPIHLVGLGEMGIGNTTPSSALASLLTGAAPEQVTGCGTGLTQEQRHQKVAVIEKALNLHRPDPKDPWDCLAKVGGFEIGCLAGIVLAAAQARVPVFVDGFITSAAALVACRIAPAASHFLIASHRSVEPGHAVVLKALGIEPLLDLNLRLGEGTGAALGMFLAQSSIRLLSEMATFQEAGVDERTA